MIRVTFVGDSTSCAGSWVDHVDAANVELVGGCATAGFTSAQLLPTAAAVSADVLVVMVGVNDIRLGVSSVTTLANIEAIVTAVGADRVVLSAIVPNNVTDYGSAHINRKEKGEIFNRTLLDLAAAHGWLFVDPCNEFRKLDNGFKAGTTTDNVHPVESAYALMANRLEGAVRLAVNGAAA